MLCSPSFGPASPDEANRGLGGHGEALTIGGERRDSGRITRFFPAAGFSGLKVFLRMAVDLHGVQHAPKTNTLYALALPQARAVNYFTLYNIEYPILVGFLLPTTDHAWVVDWQGNDGTRITRGIEFGTSPFDEGVLVQREMENRGSLLVSI